MRSRGPGDTENAMRSIAREYGVDYGTLWRLRYRRSSIKDIGVTVYMSLKAAYQAECERQLRKLKNEIANTEAVAGAASTVVDEAKALVRTFGG
jgi:transposase-like protein